MINLHKDEHVLHVARKHWFILFGQALFIAFLFVIPFILYIILQSLPTINVLSLPGNPVYLFGALSGVWFLFLWILFFVIWTNYYLDILILTNKRIVSIDQKGLFSREVSNFRLDRIQDITVEVHGIIATFLKFGTIHIQTAGEDREFIMKGAPNPYKIKELVLKEHSRTVEQYRTNSGHG